MDGRKSGLERFFERYFAIIEMLNGIPETSKTLSDGEVIRAWRLPDENGCPVGRDAIPPEADLLYDRLQEWEAPDECK